MTTDLRFGKIEATVMEVILVESRGRRPIWLTSKENEMRGMEENEYDNSWSFAAKRSRDVGVYMDGNCMLMGMIPSREKLMMRENEELSFY